GGDAPLGQRLVGGGGDGDDRAAGRGVADDQAALLVERLTLLVAEARDGVVDVGVVDVDLHAGGVEPQAPPGDGRPVAGHGPRPGAGEEVPVAGHAVGGQVVHGVGVRGRRERGRLAGHPAPRHGAAVPVTVAAAAVASGVLRPDDGAGPVAVVAGGQGADTDVDVSDLLGERVHRPLGQGDRGGGRVAAGVA